MFLPIYINMAPVVSNLSETEESLRFEIANVDVSIVNSLRRVVLTNLDQMVFRGFPHSENQLVFHKNNTKFNMDQEAMIRIDVVNCVKFI